LVAVLDYYRQILRAFREAEGGAKARVLVELRSREMLVVWVVFCLVHHDCKTSYSALAAMFGVPIRWGDLRHECLEDREAWEAAGRVRGYLEANTVEGSELFQLSKPVPTLRFAEAFASQDAGMCEVLNLEKEDAGDRKAEYWAAVQEKRDLSATLREKIAKLEESVETLNGQQEEIKRKLRVGEYPDAAEGQKEERKINRQIDLAKLHLIDRKRELANAQQVPPAVLQPLPAQDELANRVIFMLTMPLQLRLLARLSALAQQMLLPVSVKRAQVTKLHALSIHALLPNVAVTLTSRRPRLEAAEYTLCPLLFFDHDLRRLYFSLPIIAAGTQQHCHHGAEGETPGICGDEGGQQAYQMPGLSPHRPWQCIPRRAVACRAHCGGRYHRRAPQHLAPGLPVGHVQLVPALERCGAFTGFGAWERSVF
jgi:hypothetical protein